MSKSRVVFRSVTDRSILDAVREIFDVLAWQSIVPSNANVVIKVNLSTPFQENATVSNTSPEILDAVCTLLKERTTRITVGESDGMRYKAEDAFEVSGYLPILAKHGAKPVNFSRDDHVSVEHTFGKQWVLPRTLLEADVFMTLPVLKTHATTYFTGSLKNQFGCYPQYNRILLHPRLDEAIVFINRLLRPRIVVMDAIVAMEGRGPINGRPRQLGIVMAGTDPVAVDATAMRLVGLDPMKCKHAVMAHKGGIGQIHEGEIEIDGNFDKHRTQFEPAEKDLPIKLLALISRSKILTDALILNPESFTPLRSAALLFRDFRDRLKGKPREPRAT